MYARLAVSRAAALPMVHGSLAMAGKTRRTGQAGAGVGYRCSPWLTLVVFLLLIRLAVFAKGFGEATYGRIDIYALAEIGLTVAGAVLLLREPALRAVLVILWRTSARYIYWYYLFGAVSTFWSEMPVYTLFRAFEILVEFTAIFVILLSRWHFLRAERFFLGASLAAAGLEVLGLFRLYGYVPGILHTNSYSNIGLMVFGYCLAEWFTARQPRKSALFWYGAGGLFFVVLGTSATTNIATVITVGAAALLEFSRAKLKCAVVFLVLLGVLIVGFTLMPREQVYAVLMPGKGAKEIETFTGRTWLWEQLMERYWEEPLLGYGFIASTRYEGQQFHSAHNLIIQALLDTGAVGSGLVLWALWAVGRESWRAFLCRLPGSSGCLVGLLSVAVVNSTTPFVVLTWDKTLFGFAVLVAFYTLFIAAGYARRAKAPRRLPAR